MMSRMESATIPSEPSTKRLKVESADTEGSENGSHSSDSESDQSEQEQKTMTSVPSETPEDVSFTHHQDTSSNRQKLPSSNDNEIDVQEKMVLFLTGKPSSARSRYAKAFKFPSKLFYVLECGDYNDVISWTPDGNSFTVYDPDAFTAKVPAAVLREAKFSSFHRKLNRWNFVKVPGESRTYTHPRFKKGDLDLCKTITCSGQTLNQWGYASADGDGPTRPGGRGDMLNPALMAGHGLPPNANNGMRDLQYQVYQSQRQGIDPSLALAAEQRLAYYAQMGSFPPGHSTMVDGAPIHALAVESPFAHPQGVSALDNRLVNNYQMNRPMNLMSSMPIYNDGGRGNYFVPSGQIPFSNQMVGYSYNPAAVQMAPNFLSFDALRQQQQGQGQMPSSLIGAAPLNLQQVASLNRHQMDTQLRNRTQHPNEVPKVKEA
mmetsp:Transcript_835/g.1444  ORF Transcript_835/g.1444 Transcript_835/m.1444 type:complete len:432 (-) Transcript_835:55-1350(-)